MSLSFCEAVRKRCENNHTEKSRQIYFKEVDSLIQPVYRRRYLTLEPQIHGAVSFLTFQNACWDKMEGPKGQGGTLLLQICQMNFAGDNFLRQYIKQSFERLLQDLIYDRSPGLKTRINQLNRCLKKICDQISYGSTASSHKMKQNQKKTPRRQYWKLKGLETIPPLPAESAAELEALRACLQDCPPPKARYPRSEESQHGKSLSDKEMRAFLHSILTKIGGVVSKNTLITFICEIYHCPPVIFLPPPTAPGDRKEEDETDGLEEIFSDLALSQEYAALAKELINGCLEPLLPVFIYRFCQQLSQTDIAKKLSLSNATVSNKINVIESCFHNFIQEHPMTKENLVAFVRLMCSIILSSEEVCHET